MASPRLRPCTYLSPIVTSVTTFWRLASDLEWETREGRKATLSHIGGRVDAVEFRCRWEREWNEYAHMHDDATTAAVVTVGIAIAETSTAAVSVKDNARNT